MKNEDPVLKKLLKFLEQRKKEKFTNIHSPEDEERNKKAPDLAFRGLNGNNYVLEHTRIESFVDQIGEGHRFENLLKPLSENLTGKLPKPGHYILTVGASSLAYPKKIDKIRQSLSAWILQEAPSLEMWEEPTQTNHFKTVKLPDVPFEVTLLHWPGLDGQFKIARGIPNNLEQERAKRIKKALDEKCPKLQSIKGKDSISILVLESNDIALGNAVKIAQAVAEELSKRTEDIPDEIYLIETETSNWYLWILKEGSKTFPETFNERSHVIT